MKIFIIVSCIVLASCSSQEVKDIKDSATDCVKAAVKHCAEEVVVDLGVVRES